MLKSCHPASLFRKLHFFFFFSFKLWGCEATSGTITWKGLPLLHLHDQTGEQWKTVCTQSVNKRSGLPARQTESPLTSENPLTRLVLTLLMKLESLVHWEVRNHNLCLFGTAVSKKAPRQLLSLISIWFFNTVSNKLSNFCISTAKAWKVEHCETSGEPEVRLTGRWHLCSTDMLFSVACRFYKHAHSEFLYSWRYSLILKYHNY